MKKQLGIVLSIISIFWIVPAAAANAATSLTYSIFFPPSHGQAKVGED